jgi:small multidrug resistance pump
MSIPMAYLYLTIAITAEVVATTALKASQSFTRPGPTVLVCIGYAIAFFALSRCLETMTVGVTYAIWSGLGILLVTLTSAVIYHQVPARGEVAGMAIIILGVVVLNLNAQTPTN